jgi:hypothetical protein
MDEEQVPRPVVKSAGREVERMKTKALTLVLVAALAIPACQSSRQNPPQQPPQPTGTGAPPPPNPNPEPPTSPVATPVATAKSVAPPPSAPVPPGAPAPPPAAAVPEQPVIATDEPPAAPAARPHEEILRMKQSGASDGEILARVKAENVNYHLTTADVISLRGAGVSQTILEAMLRSGQPAPPAR